MNQRDERLDTLLDELRHTARVRRARGATLLAGALALALSFVLWPAGPGATTPGPVPVPRVANSGPDPERAPAPSARTPALIAVSNTVTPTTVERISDDTLLELLNTDGRRTGLIERDGEVILDARWLSDSDGADDDRGV
ncbi:MAG: hypothetical protein AAGH64_12305 [Planctomycetota bacterium]